MLTNGVYSEPAVGIAQISIHPHTHPPSSPNIDELPGKKNQLQTHCSCMPTLLVHTRR